MTHRRVFIDHITIRVRDLDRAADCLASWQVDHEEPEGRILVPCGEANGAVLEFVEAR
jgi:hypothetical protein